jgi:hypothetical protein
MNKLQRIIILLWAVVLGTIAMSVVAAGLLLGTRKWAGRGVRTDFAHERACLRRVRGVSFAI